MWVETRSQLFVVSKSSRVFINEKLNYKLKDKKGNCSKTFDQITYNIKVEAVTIAKFYNLLMGAINIKYSEFNVMFAAFHKFFSALAP